MVQNNTQKFNNQELKFRKLENITVKKGKEKLNKTWKEYAVLGWPK